jgi:mannosyltransferase OCH1-like enzyme
MKADLWRYCIIYTYGGIYADIDALCITDTLDFLLEDGPLLITSPEAFAPEEKISKYFNQWIFSAPKNSPILKLIIDLIIDANENIEYTYYKYEIHNLTGPSIFTQGIEKYLLNNNIQLFNNKEDYIYANISDLKIIKIDDMYHNKFMHGYCSTSKNGWIRNKNEQRLRYLMRVFHYDINLKKTTRWNT